MAFKTTIAQDDQFLPPIYRSESGTWVDFHFAQKLLDFFDQITPATPIGGGQSPGPSKATLPTSSGINLAHLLLRLTLVTLFETDAVLHTERIQRKKENLRQVEAIVSSNFSEGGGKLSIMR